LTLAKKKHVSLNGKKEKNSGMYKK